MGKINETMTYATVRKRKSYGRIYCEERSDETSMKTKQAIKEGKPSHQPGWCEGKYIYCIIETSEPEKFGPLGIGGRNDELYTINFDDIAAVVSNSQILKYSVSRENTITHEKAIETVMEKYPPLPVRFATIAEDKKKVKKILRKEYDRFKELLEKIKNKKELGLKAIFKEGIYNEILDKYEDIRALKEKIKTLSSEQTYYQRMKIGKMVEHALEREKEIVKEEILAALSPLAEEIKVNNNYGERMVVNAAFLINQEKEPEFDLKVSELDEKYSDKIKFKYVGKLPPFNFVNIVINTKDY